MVVLLAALLFAPTLSVQTSEISVVPPELLPLGGYTARQDAKFEPGGDDLFARTVVFTSGETKVAVVSLESLTIPESLVREVKKRIPEDVDLMLVATHTHSAPDSQMLNDRMTFKIPGIASFSRRWLTWYSDRIAEGINLALYAEKVSADRLGLATAAVDSNRGRREGAEPIKQATWAVLAGKPVLTVYAAHGTIYDEDRRSLSGDWPGVYARKVGGLLLPGAIGDVSPAYPTDDPVENLKAMAEKLELGIGSAQVIGAWGEGAVLTYIEELIQLEKVVAHPGFAEEYGVGPPLDQVVVGRFAPKEGHVSLLQVGKMLIVGVPGEPSSAIARKVQVLAQGMGFPHSVTISHCNGWIGYVLEPEDYDKGGYEATLSFHGRETSERVVEAVNRGMKKLEASNLSSTTSGQAG